MFVSSAAPGDSLLAKVVSCLGSVVKADSVQEESATNSVRRDK